MIQYVHGPSGLREYKDILRDMREQKRKHEYRKQEIKDAIITWTFGILISLAGAAGMAVLFYFIGKQQGKWQMILMQIGAMRYAVYDKQGKVVIITSSREIAERYAYGKDDH